MKKFNWVCVFLMIGSSLVMYFSPERQLFHEGDMNAKIAAAVFIFSLIGLLGGLGVFDPRD